WSDVEEANVEGVRLDELPARLDFVTHQSGEDLVGLVAVLDLHLEQRPRLRVHRRLPELRRVHLAEALVALHLEPLARLGHDARDRLLEVRHLLRTLALPDRVRWFAGGRELARQAAELLELWTETELAIDEIAVRGAVGARGGDQRETGVLTIRLEGEAHGQQLGRRDLQVHLRPPPLHAVEWRLRDEEMPALDDLLIVPVEEGEQQGADVGAVDVGVAHEDDGVVAQLREVLVLLAHARTEGGDEHLDLL